MVADRNVAVAANTTIGGISGNAARIRLSIYPAVFGRTSNNSITLQIVGVSYRASFSSTGPVILSIIFDRPSAARVALHPPPIYCRRILPSSYDPRLAVRATRHARGGASPMLR